MRRHHYIAIGMVVITLAVFGQAINHEFINYDDHKHVYDNPRLKPVTLDKTLQFWGEPHKLPLTYTFWAIQAKLGANQEVKGNSGGFNSKLYHFSNILIHLLSVLTVFSILRILFRTDWGACAGALLFGLHPIQVEPVVWVTGLRDVLSL